MIKSYKRQQGTNPFFIILLTAFSYFLAARLGYNLMFSHTVVLPLWAPPGVALALMLLFNARYVGVGIMVGSVLTSYYAAWNTPDVNIVIRICIMIIAAMGRALEAFAGYVLIRKLITSSLFSIQRNVFRFLFISIVISFIGAAVLLAALILFQIKTPENFFKLFFNYTLGNLVGILLFSPLILLLAKAKFQRPKVSNQKDFAVFLLLVAFVLGLLQLDMFTYPLMHALPFIVVPYLLWLASRFNLWLAFTGVFVASIFALYYTVVVRSGPFVIPDSGEYSMLYLQVFIVVISFSTLLLGAATEERNHAQKELKKLNENLEQNVQQRTMELMKRNAELDNFVYRVSHDLRAPIASILGLINVAMTDQESSREYLELMRKSALKQDGFIREILDHAKNSRSETKPQEIVFDELINQVWNDIQPADIKVVKTLSINQADPFICDAWRLQVIFNNILSNAIRYRRDNIVEINIHGTVTKTKAEINIEDKGQGISAAHLDRVFEMFYRANERSSGSGLGLYIVKETVTKLGGDIKIKSTLDGGTSVVVSFPALV